MPSTTQAARPSASLVALEQDAGDLGAADQHVVRPFELQLERRRAEPDERLGRAPGRRPATSCAAAAMRAVRAQQQRGVEIAGRRGPGCGRGGRGPRSARRPSTTVPAGAPARARRCASSLVLPSRSCACRTKPSGSRQRGASRRTAPPPPPGPGSTAGSDAGRTPALRTAVTPTTIANSRPIGRSKRLARLVEIHHLDDPQVIVGADHARQHADHRERHEARLDRRAGTRRACRRSRRAAGCRPART